MSDANYAISGFGMNGTGSGTYTALVGIRNETTYASVITTSSTRIVVIGHDGNIFDPLFASISIFR
jgi:hypothetical protein